MVVLQELPTPTVGLCTDVDLYLRVQGRGWFSFPEAAAVLFAGDVLTTDTYFGALPTGKWFRHTSIRRVEVVVAIDGEADVEAVHNRPGHDPVIVAAVRHDGASGEALIALPSIAELGEGHVFVRVRALTDGVRFRGMIARSPDPAPHDVRLGVAITTFNRHQYVRVNVARLAAHLDRRPDLRDRVCVQIVDNGRNLELRTPPRAPIEVVPNRNLGGAGGFARGLMELRDSGWATHALFMDDDITFEPEVLGRTVALLRYATDSRLCVAGGMLEEEVPRRQFEAGANIATHASHIWQVVGGGRDLGKVSDLLLNDVDEPFEYGGWWYFAFPIDLTDDYPLPVFVRGDDVCFGLRYAAGHNVAVNGIGVWHQHFGVKNGPALFFYEARNVPIVLTVSRPDYSAASLNRRLVERTLRFASALRYDSATAVLDGVEAYLEGPDGLLRQPADLFNDEVRARYGEAVGPLPPDRSTAPVWVPPPPPLPVLLRATSLLTLGGHLVPSRLRRSVPRGVALDATPAMATICADELVFRDPVTGDGFVGRRDQVRFRRILGRLWRLRRRVNAEFDTVAARWRAAYPVLVSDGFWREQFDVADATRDAATSA